MVAKSSSRTTVNNLQGSDVACDDEEMKISFQTSFKLSTNDPKINKWCISEIKAIKFVTFFNDNAYAHKIARHQQSIYTKQHNLWQQTDCRRDLSLFYENSYLCRIYRNAYNWFETVSRQHFTHPGIRTVQTTQNKQTRTNIRPCLHFTVQ